MAETDRFITAANQKKPKSVLIFNPIDEWPIRFELWFEDDGATVVLNDIYTHELWRGRDLCNHVFAALEALPGVRRVCVFRPNALMQSIIEKHGYLASRADNAWFKALCSDEKRGRSPLI